MPDLKPEPQSASRLQALRWAAPLIVAMLTALAFVRILSNELLSWDDLGNLVENDAYRGFGPAQLRWMFTTFHLGPYQPLSWLSYACDYALWGLRPFGFHLGNLLLHTICAGAFYFLVLRLIALARPEQAGAPAARVAAMIAALVFAVHPLRVESVAWATERRDVLSGLFFVLTLHAYLRYASAPRTGRYVLTLLLFVLASLAKAIVMTVPVVLVLLDFYPLRRLRRGDRRVWLEKLPFLLVSAGTAYLAVVGQRTAGALGSLEDLTFAQRSAVAAYAACFYVWKTIVPIRLGPMYELPVSLDPRIVRFIACELAVAVGTVVAWRIRRRLPFLAVAWLFYLVTLAPISGLVQVGRQIAADRYTYLPGMAFGALVAAAILDWAVRSPNALRRAGLACGAVVLVLAGLTAKQTSYWHDSVRIWTRALDLDPDCAFAHYNLSLLLQDRGDLKSALRHAEAAARLRPASSDTLWNYGLVLLKSGSGAEADDYLRRGSAGRQQSIAELFEYGGVLVEAGRDADALAVFERILQRQPDHRRAILALGLLYAKAGMPEKARGYLERGLAGAEPDAFVDAARALFQGRRPQEAIALLRRAVDRFPVDASLTLRLAWVLATHPRDDVRNGREAVRLAESALQRAGEPGSRPWLVLAAAYAEVGRFDEARAAIQRATQLARGGPMPAGFQRFVNEINAGRPLRVRP